MSYNVPTVTTNNLSFGPGVVRVGAAGSTPATQVGAISEDGVALEFNGTKRQIRQGNPLMPVYDFIIDQSMVISFTGIEWDLDRLAEAMGSGVTASGSGEDYLYFGGEPVMTLQAVQVEHVMAVPGHTLFIEMWQGAANDPSKSIAMGVNEHSFPMSWSAQRVTTDWAGNALAAGRNLGRVRRVTA